MSASWLVVCDDYKLGPFRDRETAERNMAHVEELGACHCTHRVERVSSDTVGTTHSG